MLLGKPRHDVASSPHCNLFPIYMLLWVSLSETVSVISTVRNPRCILTALPFCCSFSGSSSKCFWDFCQSQRKHCSWPCFTVPYFANSIICDFLLYLHLKMGHEDTWDCLNSISGEKRLCVRSQELTSDGVVVFLCCNWDDDDCTGAIYCKAVTFLSQGDSCDVLGLNIGRALAGEPSVY